MRDLLTFGHGTASPEELVALMQKAGVELVVDVRRFPGSRRNPRLLDRMDQTHTAIMCSESLWWRCHRRLVSDAVLLLHGRTVSHLGHDGRLTGHVPPRAATVVAGELHYDAEPQ